MKAAIIMAAGKGTRMKSSLPKTMHKVCEKPMVEHIIDTVKKVGVDQVVTIVGFGKDELKAYLSDKTQYAVQEPQLGTGHAVLQASDFLANQNGYTLVINGDCPLIQKNTYEKLFEAVEGKAMVVLTAILDDPKQYGRIVRDDLGNIVKIVENKDASMEEKKICEINTGIYAFDNKVLFENLSKIKNNNNQKEYYITDLVEIFTQQNMVVSPMVIEDKDEAMGVNDRYELSLANSWLQNKINYDWMMNGVTIIDPSQTYIGADVVIKEDTVIYPNTRIYGNTKIGKHNEILSGCTIFNSEIGDYNSIDQSRITDSKLGNFIRLGPWAHLRNGCVIEDKNRIGNFVEFKNTVFGYDSRCAHLTYLGDSMVGSKVNMGCGVVTVNYDGKNKFKTVIEDGAFIGSNVNLIAPIKIGKNAVVAAGSTVNADVAEGDMAIARVRQENKAGYGVKYKNK